MAAFDIRLCGGMSLCANNVFNVDFECLTQSDGVLGFKYLFGASLEGFIRFKENSLTILVQLSLICW